MTFFIAADAYDRFMGRYSSLLAAQLADFAGVSSGLRVLDVGCGPGALTSELVQRLGASAVAAVDPSEPFVVAAHERHPGVDVRQAAAEELPFADGEFDAALAQLVVHFMADPVRGLAEMARVTKNGGGVVCACVWDHAGDQSPLSPFWQAVRELEPGADAEANLAGTRGGHLTELFSEAGLREVEETALPVQLEHATFEDWWEPFTLGVGPAGVYLASLDATKQAELRETCRRRLPEPPFTLSARAWTARGEPAN
jgi:ubiquinone/menaquinone biosynthesis C-methylase UbiE